MSSTAMKSTIKIIGVTLVALMAFWFGRTHAPGLLHEKPAATSEVLYYQDPMHPSYRSDKPGTAPDCGMALEPVYAATLKESDQTSAEIVTVNMEAQRISGIRTVRVQTESLGEHFEAPGIVLADESRIFKVTALADGVIKSVSGFSTGSIVHKGDLLATYFVPTRDLYNAVQAYVLASGTFDQAAAAVRDQSFINTAKAQKRVEEELLKSYGLGSQQIRELARSREVTRDIDFRSPADGVVLDRNVNLGQTLARGAELARIADLSRIWVLVDVNESELAVYRPGRPAVVTYGEYSFPARVSEARQFDSVSRTFKVRLELANPKLTLRPDMFVRVTLITPVMRSVTVPQEAILDSGLQKVAYVRLANGSFAPRKVKTGVETGGRVQILDGLQEGADVAVSGTFLLDSESRLRVERAQVQEIDHRLSATEKPESDPACGMPLQHLDEALSSEYSGKHFHFCSKSCKAKFDSKPQVYSERGGEAVGLTAALGTR
jgi:Cu(I)/Ag(I) efflux system membrane fusion protein